MAAVSRYRNINLEKVGANVLAKGGQVKGWNFANTHATLFRYVKIYDKATAATGSDTPELTIGVPPLKSVDWAPGIDGTPFANGISIRGVTGVADSDATDPGANELVVNLFYLPNMP
jgi:hypothetical protein